MSLKKILSILIAATVLVGCKNDKVTCDLEEALPSIKKTIFKNYIISLSLEKAADDYKYNKTWSSSGNYTLDFKKYMRSAMDDVLSSESEYFKEALTEVKNDSFEVADIITTRYDQSINRCDCKATIFYKELNEKQELIYHITRTSEGNATGQSNNDPIIYIEGKDNPINFQFITELVDLAKN